MMRDTRSTTELLSDIGPMPGPCGTSCAPLLPAVTLPSPSDACRGTSGASPATAAPAKSLPAPLSHNKVDPTAAFCTRASLASFAKYFCAWLRICAAVRVGMSRATFFHSLPCTRRPPKNASCSAAVQRPVDPTPPEFEIFEIPPKRPSTLIPCTATTVFTLTSESGNAGSSKNDSEFSRAFSCVELDPELAITPVFPARFCSDGRIDREEIEDVTVDSPELLAPERDESVLFCEG
mmetsp:Transcript_3955/g.5343  ORF Transcript_3955/g.5343 Transcript_3955/m.5343 type:complete len:236 (-) Transcript_3955:172-879(-)